MKVLVFTTNCHGYQPTEQRVNLSEKTAVVYSSNHPKKGTKVVTKFFLEAFTEYVNARRHLRTAIKTNFVDVDLILAAYEEIMAHEEEMLMDMMLGW